MSACPYSHKFSMSVRVSIREYPVRYAEPGAGQRLRFPDIRAVPPTIETVQLDQPPLLLGRYLRRVGGGGGIGGDCGAETGMGDRWWLRQGSTGMCVERLLLDNWTPASRTRESDYSRRERVQYFRGISEYKPKNRTFAPRKCVSLADIANQYVRSSDSGLLVPGGSG